MEYHDNMIQTVSDVNKDLGLKAKTKAKDLAFGLKDQVQRLTSLQSVTE